MDIGQSALYDFARAVATQVTQRRTTADATVTRVEGGTTWVMLAGSDVETPIAQTSAEVSVGDAVSVEWRGNALRIAGNATAPSVGATYVGSVVDAAQAVTAKAVSVVSGIAEQARAVADAIGQHFWTADDGVHVTQETQDSFESSASGRNILLNAYGILLRDATTWLASFTEGAVAFFDGTGNADANVFASFGTDGAQIGNAATGSVLTMDADSLDMAHGSTEMLHFGYGEGNTQGGTGEAPYYSLGVRRTASSAYSTSATYEVGDLVTYDGAEYVCKQAITSPSSWNSNYWMLTVGSYSHAEGHSSTASGAYSHAEGRNGAALGIQAHVEGFACKATGSTAHAEGDKAAASGECAHAEGYGTTASGYYAHAEGYGTTASGHFSHAQNDSTVTAYSSQTAIGKYNANSSDNAFEVGNGTADDARSNAFAVGWDGTLTMDGDVAWTALTLDSAVEAYDSSSTPRYRRWGPMVTLMGAVKVTAEVAAGGTWSIGTLPSGCYPAQGIALLCQGTRTHQWLMRVSSAGAVTGERYRNGNTNIACATTCWLPFAITYMTS